MTHRDFCYWLQGYMEIERPEEIDADRTQVIKDHLALTFKKETPDRVYISSLISMDDEPNKNGDIFTPNTKTVWNCETSDSFSFGPHCLDEPHASC